jgi:hypothetical protein
VAETVTRRLTMMTISGPENYGGRPYAEVFPGMVVETTPDGAVVIDLEPAAGVPAALLMDLMARRQLAIVVWGG